MTENKLETKAGYFGLLVEVIHSLEQVSLIRFEEREFVVETSDLVFGSVEMKCSRKQAA